MPKDYRICVGTEYWVMGDTVAGTLTTLCCGKRPACITDRRLFDTRRLLEVLRY